MALGGAIDFTK